MRLWFGKGAKKNTAKKVLRSWEKNQVSNISKDILRMIPDKTPFLKDMAEASLSSMINKNLEFSAGEAEEISSDLYSIKDRVRVRLGPGIPFIRKQFTISVDYNVEIDVKEKKVAKAGPDISSLKIEFV